jgi:hypothetical protein
MIITTGVQVGSPTGGDMGAGTVNATGLYVNGSSVSSPSRGTQTVSNGGTYDISIAAHGAYLYAVYDQSDRSYYATGMIICDGTYCNNTPMANAGGLSASNSGLNFRIVNSTGGSRSVYWSLLRIN